MTTVGTLDTQEDADEVYRDAERAMARGVDPQELSSLSRRASLLPTDEVDLETGQVTIAGRRWYPMVPVGENEQRAILDQIAGVLGDLLQPPVKVHYLGKLGDGLWQFAFAADGEACPVRVWIVGFAVMTQVFWIPDTRDLSDGILARRIAASATGIIDTVSVD